MNNQYNFHIDLTHAVHKKLFNDYPRLLQYYKGYDLLKKGWKRDYFYFENECEYPDKIKQFVSRELEQSK